MSQRQLLDSLFGMPSECTAAHAFILYSVKYVSVFKMKKLHIITLIMPIKKSI